MLLPLHNNLVRYSAGGSKKPGKLTTTGIEDKYFRQRKEDEIVLKVIKRFVELNG